MGSCASSNVVIELPEVDNTAGISQTILQNIMWDPYTRDKLSDIKNPRYRSTCKNTNLDFRIDHDSIRYTCIDIRYCDEMDRVNNSLLYAYYSHSEVYRHVVFKHFYVVNQLRHIVNNDIHSRFIDNRVSYYKCRGNEEKIAKRFHKKYFKQHVEEELIAYVCHPDNCGKFEALGFYD
jgi:hypothetical protein